MAAAISDPSSDNNHVLKPGIYGNLGFIMRQVVRLIRVNKQEFSLGNVRSFLFSRSWAERKASITTLFASDPYTLQRLVHSIPGPYSVSVSDDGMILVMLDFEAYVKIATTFRSRGHATCEYFSRLFHNSAFIAEPRKYANKPYGVWEDRKDVEPHVLCKDAYYKQVPDIERIIDDAILPNVGQVAEVGKLLRKIVWDVIVFGTFGIKPNKQTERLLQVFEDSAPEFDYALRIGGEDLSNEWSDHLRKLNEELYSWCVRVCNERKPELENGVDKDRTDILTYVLKTYKTIPMNEIEGPMKAVFTASFNNVHCALCGLLFKNAELNDAAYEYMKRDPEKNLDQVTRETLRLHTAIPVTRKVNPEDNFDLDGKKIPVGATIVLPTYAINTDPRVWDEPLEFKPERFEGRKDVGYLCQPGFMPFGAAWDLGGRQCAGRFFSYHVVSTMTRKLLSSYKMMSVGHNNYFDMKNSAGTSLFRGSCKVKVEKRE